MEANESRFMTEIHGLFSAVLGVRDDVTFVDTLRDDI
jgi:hypothetical protein